MGSLSDVDTSLWIFLGIEIIGVVVGLVGILMLLNLQSGYMVLIPIGTVIVTVGTIGFSKIYDGGALLGQISSGSTSTMSILDEEDVEKPVVDGNGQKIGHVEKDANTGVHIAVSPGALQGRAFESGSRKLTEEDGLSKEHLDVEEQRVILRWPAQKESEAA